VIQGRIPGTDTWRPIREDPEAVEDASGTLIIRIRENLDFGSYRPELRWLHSYPYCVAHPANAAQLKGLFTFFTTIGGSNQRVYPTERLRRLELYGHDRSHPSDEPRRPQTTVLIFHMADVDTVDASYVRFCLTGG